MARKECHILNGDALKAQLPQEIDGEIIVMPECLIDGPVSADHLEEFFETRAKFISIEYGGTKEEYFKKVVGEFRKIENLPAQAAIHLWFEDDLFCQVNFWFIIHLLIENNQSNIFLIRPPVHNQYGFGGLSKEQLLMAYENKMQLKDLSELTKLWPAYQQEKLYDLKQLAHQLKDKYPFLVHAVEAHIERFPTDDNPGRPIQSLVAIMDELQTKEFGPIFKEFCRRESIYGFGDLLVNRLLNQVIE